MGFKLWGLFLCLFLLWGRSNIIQFFIVKAPTFAVWETILGETRASVGQVMETERSHQFQGMFQNTEITGPADGLNLQWVSGKNKRSIKYYI